MSRGLFTLMNHACQDVAYSEPSGGSNNWINISHDVYSSTLKVRVTTRSSA
jgi:hypothetical protein